MYAGNYVGALEALDAGVTTILDFSHCNNTPEHADAALQGLRDAGIRAMFAYGYFPAPVAEPRRSPSTTSGSPTRGGSASESSPRDDALVTMGVALTEVGLLPFDRRSPRRARRASSTCPTVLHTGCSWGSPITEGIPELDAHGLLGPDQVHVHCNTLDDRDFRRLAEPTARSPRAPRPRSRWGWATR